MQTIFHRKPVLSLITSPVSCPGQRFELVPLRFELTTSVCFRTEHRTGFQVRGTYNAQATRPIPTALACGPFAHNALGEKGMRTRRARIWRGVMCQHISLQLHTAAYSNRRVLRVSNKNSTPPTTFQLLNIFFRNSVPALASEHSEMS